MASTIGYLIEIRQRLLKCIVCIVALFIPLFFYANPLFNLLAAPLSEHLKGNMIAIHITSPLLIPIELAVKASLLLSMPYILYQAWAFLAPALYQNEKRLIQRLLIASVFLFYLGVAFCYFIVLPMMFAMLLKAAPDKVQLMPDISYYLSLTGRFFLIFGLSFEVPVVNVFLLKSGVLSLASLKKARPYVIVAAFTIGMLLTPPDVLSQIMLAIPICILYELGLIYGKMTVQKPHKQLDTTST